MINQIKRIIKDYLDAQQPADLMFGTVTNQGPLEVTVNQRFTLTEAFLVVPEHLLAFQITIGSTEYEIRRGLETGDKVVLMRASGGNQFMIAGRLES